MPVRPRKIALAFVAAAALYAAPAQASNPSAAALAESLFAEGKKLMVAKRFDEACPKLAESHRLDPGGGTVLTLALCYEGQGKLASAWGAYHEVLTMAKKDSRSDRERIAKKHIDKLESRLPMLTLKIDPATAGLPDLEIKDGDVTLGRATWDAPFPVDPGGHTFSARAAEKRPWTKTIDVHPGPLTLDVPALESLPKPEPAPAAHEPAAPAPGDVAREPPRSSGGGATTVLGIVALGVGVAGLAAGGITGALLIGHRSTIDAHCDPGRACDPDGLAAASAVDTLKPINLVAFIVGAVGVVAGTALLVLGPRAPAPPARVGRF